MPLFNSGLAVNYFGYKRVFVPVNVSQSLKEEEIPYFPLADPRGKLPPGMAPSKALSYRTYTRFFELTGSTSGSSNTLASFISPLGGGAAALVALGGVLGDVTFAFSHTMIALVFFEGRDVIDLPTAGLRREGDVIFVPDNVARPLFASETPWITGNQSVARASALLYGGRKDPRNLLVGVRRSEAPTDDVKTVYNRGFPENDTIVLNDAKISDTASNAIIVSGSPKFISYVAIDRPLFRDVILTRVGSQVAGLATATGGFSATDTSFDGTGYSYMLRFAWVNLVKDGEDPKFGWRLSQSMNVPRGQPSESEFSDIPKDLFDNLSADDKSLARLYTFGRHYAYDLNDPAPDTKGNRLDIVPAKRAFHPLLARAMADADGQYFDENSSFQFIDTEPDFGSLGLTDMYAVGLAGGANPIGGASPTPVVEFGFTSPRWKFTLTAQTRMLMEYAVRTPGGLRSVLTVGFRRYPFGLGTISGTSDLQILATSVESKSGLAAVNDCCLYMTRVFDVVSGGVGPMIVDRQFDDFSWQSSTAPVPSSTSKKFMLGEFPFRSEGRPIFLPKQKSLGTASDGKVTLGASDFITTLLMKASKAASGGKPFEASSSKEGGEPIFEASLGDANVPDGESQVGIGVPGIRFEAYEDGGGLALIEVFGAKKDDPLAPAYGGAPATAQSSSQSSQKKDDKAATEQKLLKFSDDQLAKVDAQTWPIEANNIAACSDCASGDLYLAFENGNRVDMAIGNCTEVFSLVRDVALRVPDEQDEKKSSAQKKSGGDDDLPPATLPFLLQDGSATKNLFLFYYYKDKILCKSVPMEIFSKPTGDDGFYPVETERSIAQSMHKVGADLVYDGAGDVEDAAKSQAATGSVPPKSPSIFRDMEVGAVRVRQDEGDPPQSSERPEQAVQYSAFLDVAGYMFCFIQAGKGIVVRRSTDLSEKWIDALPRDFRFVQPTPTKEGEEGANKEETDGEAPFALYDEGTQDVLLFMTLDQALLYVKFPAEMLRKPPNDVAEGLKPFLKPKLLFGRMTKKLFDRGIEPASVVNAPEAKDDPSNRLPSQRVAAVKTTEGYYRVFFRDDDVKLRSLVSFDVGNTWRYVDEVRGQETQAQSQEQTQ
jgi:hypothetical protein